MSARTLATEYIRSTEITVIIIIIIITIIIMAYPIYSQASSEQ